MKVTVESYNKDVHGYVDDCDYKVVLWADSNPIELCDLVFVETIINKLGYYKNDYKEYNHGDWIEYFLCHA